MGSSFSSSFVFPFIASVLTKFSCNISLTAGLGKNLCCRVAREREVVSFGTLLQEQVPLRRPRTNLSHSFCRWTPHPSPPFPLFYLSILHLPLLSHFSPLPLLLFLPSPPSSPHPFPVPSHPTGREGSRLRSPTFPPRLSSFRSYFFL